MSEQLGERIRTLLTRYGMSQKTLANRARVSTASISKYISGEVEPSAATLANIATALHTTSSELLGEKEQQWDTPYGTVMDICARHGGDFSDEQIRRLITTLLEAKECTDGKV